MDTETLICIKIMIGSAIVGMALLRLIFVLPLSSKLHCKNKRKNAKLMIFLGSGGHTAEMMQMISKVDLNNFQIIWVLTQGDFGSLEKCKDYEIKNKESSAKSQIFLVKKTRKVHEGFISSIWSALKSFLNISFCLLKMKEYPSTLIMNGPGTSVPIGVIFFFLRFLGFCDTMIVYVESLARVSSLSTSGLILLPIVDRLIVQWESLSLKYNKAEYHGILV